MSSKNLGLLLSGSCFKNVDLHMGLSRKLQTSNYENYSLGVHLKRKNFILRSINLQHQWLMVIIIVYFVS